MAEWAFTHNDSHSTWSWHALTAQRPSLSTGCSRSRAGSSARAHIELSFQEAHALIEEQADNAGFLVLDDRSDDEFRRGHLRGAVMMDSSSPEFDAGLAALDRNGTYLVHCASGFRSASAERRMDGLGFAGVYPMPQDIYGWSQHTAL